MVDTTKVRGETLDVRDKVLLSVSFKDGDGYLTDPDFPATITIVQPNGQILVGPTGVGIERLSVGSYAYTLTIPPNGPYGVFQDVWIATIDNYRVESVLSFVVVGTDIPSVNSDGFAKLGDEYPFHYSQVAIKNINKIMKMVKARLNSSGKIKIKDSFGNDQFVNCDIFSVETLTTFIAMALAYFNSIPYFTFFTMDDDGFIAQFGEILAEGAVMWAMASQALIERGREYQISDNGLSFTPPTVSELLNSQSSAMMQQYYDQVKLIKNSLRPAALGLGVFSLNSSVNPAFKRMRHNQKGRAIY